MSSATSANVVDYYTISLTAGESENFRLAYLKVVNSSPFSVQGTEEAIAHKFNELIADGPKRTRKLEVSMLLC